PAAMERNQVAGLAPAAQPPLCHPYAVLGKQRAQVLGREGIDTALRTGDRAAPTRDGLVADADLSRDLAVGEVRLRTHQRERLFALLGLRVPGTPSPDAAISAVGRQPADASCGQVKRTASIARQKGNNSAASAIQAPIIGCSCSLGCTARKNGTSLA